MKRSYKGKSVKVIKSKAKPTLFGMYKLLLNLLCVFCALCGSYLIVQFTEDHQAWV